MSSLLLPLSPRLSLYLSLRLSLPPLRATLAIALGLIACTASLPAWAIWQCQVNGQTVFQNEACPGGKPIASAPPVNPAERAQASAQAARDKALLAKLTAERKKREAQEAKQAAANARLAAKQQQRQKQCQQMALRQKWAEQDASRAAGPKRDQLQAQARRSGEKYRALCGAG